VLGTVCCGDDDAADGWQVPKSLKESSVRGPILDLGVLVPDSQLANTKELFYLNSPLFYKAS